MIRFPALSLSSRLPALAGLGLAIALGACAPNTSGSVYAPGQALQAQYVQHGVITNVRTVELRNVPGESDRLIGGIAGGALGAQIGGELSDDDRFAAGAGAILGALAGQAGAAVVNRIPVREWTVDLERGGTIVVLQNDESLFVGQRVRVIRSGSEVRLAP